MNTTRRHFLPALAALPTLAKKLAGAAEDMTWKLWYAQPAARWLDALPLGNGRLGAMVFGGVQKERIALNESTVWSGSPNRGNVNPSAREHLAQVRELLFEGKFVEGNALANKYLGGREDSYGTHLPMADLVIESGDANAQNYRRSLDLESGVARVAYSSGGHKFTRETFVSNPDNVAVVRFACDAPGQLDVAISLDPGKLPGEVDAQGKDSIVLAGSSWESKHSDGHLGIDFQVWARALAEGGSVAINNGRIEVKGANALTILVAADTNYTGPGEWDRCRAAIEHAGAKGYAALLRSHLEDHARLYQRVAIDLGGADAASQSIDKRLSAVRAGASDPHLSALFFQYARYLLIAGSRANSPLPMNLQGIWNDNLAANMVWTCDFHLDINTQQNYWHSETCNLSECGEPLFRLVESLCVQGRETARNMYGASGWVCHVYTNAWGYTAPGRGLPWGIFPTGGVWAASHLWEHYLFTRDRAFLEKRAYPVLKEAAEFFLDYMVEHPKRGWLVTGPSISPENQFLSEGKRCCVSMGPTVDRAFVHGLYSSVIQASKDLNADQAFRAKVEAARARLSPFQIGKHGQLQEWLEDFDEPEPNHRHTSHLVGLYPLDQITVSKTPDLAKAARVTIERRTGQKNWQDVEWSRANLVNFYARLGDAEEAHKHLVGLLKEDTDTNLMTFSRAGIAGAQDNIFAIDGNTAGAAGVVEMLLQSHDDIHLLPALPKEWPAGSVKGLRARGGLEVDIAWKDNILASATLRSKPGGKFAVRYGEASVQVDLKPGVAKKLNQKLA